MSQKRRPDLVTRTIDSEMIILDQSAGTVHHLNSTAGHIWSTCDEAHSAADIAARVAARFGEAPETVLRDVVATLADFQRLGLLVDGNMSIPKAGCEND
jgi:PqqD family protein of HPr-rel-A system